MGEECLATSLFALSILICRQWQSSLCNKVKKKVYSVEHCTDDECHSMFYGDKIVTDGVGFPMFNSVGREEVDRLKTVHPEYVRLSNELYGAIVANVPTVCVDVICQREVDNKILLFYRRDKPAKGFWWLPGGRMLKGETFYDTALRKLKDEMGHGSSLDGQVEAVAVLNVWNTFFPDSSWDNYREEGKRGCQTVDITIMCRLKAKDPHLYDVKAGDSSDWAVDAYRWVEADELLREGSYDKYVRVNAECARRKKLI